MAKSIIPIAAGIVALAGITAAAICFIRRHNQLFYQGGIYDGEIEIGESE